MSVANHQDLVLRYPTTKDRTAEEVNSNHLPFAEAEITGLLAPYFTAPFSSNNMTVKDLVLQLCYSKIGGLSFDDRRAIREEVYARIEKLTTGKEQMVLIDGTVVPVQASGAVWSSTEDYLPTFTQDKPEYWVQDSNYLEDVRDERDQS